MRLFNANSRIAIDIVYLLKSRGHLRNSDMAETIGKSPSFVEQTAAKLRKAGILIAFRGPGGGYALRSEPVSLLEVLEACGQYDANRVLMLHESDKLEEQVNDYFNKVVL